MIRVMKGTGCRTMIATPIYPVGPPDFSSMTDHRRVGRERIRGDWSTLHYRLNQQLSSARTWQDVKRGQLALHGGEMNEPQRFFRLDLS